MITSKTIAVSGLAVVVLGTGVWVISQQEETPAVVQESVSASPTMTVTPSMSEKPSVSPSATPTPTPTPTPKPVTAALTLSGVAKADGVHLSWKAYASSDFSYYKVVRSETNSNLKYPDDGYILYSTEKGLAAYTDETSVAGKSYYYRICVKVESGEVKCGNVIRLAAVGPKEAATPKPTAQEGGYTPVSDSLKLTAVKADEGMALSWTKFNKEGFSYYKVVRSETNSDLYYPHDGYIKVSTEQDLTSYVDADGEAGKSYYYRICAKVAAGTVYCGNVVQKTY
jgi:hypothetical protein